MRPLIATRSLFLVGAALLAAAWTVERGAHPTARGGVPVGEWSGQGVCLYEWWDPLAPSVVEEATKAAIRDALGDDAAGESFEALPLDAEVPAEHAGQRDRPVTIHRRYPTVLKIWEDRLAGHEVLMLDIHSRRGPLPGLGPETRMIVALEPVKRLSHATVLYRVLGLAFRPEEGKLPTVNETAPPCSATCTTVDDTTVLQIRYLEDFVDVFRFKGSQVEKTGLYHARGGLIHWTEQLRKQRS